MSEILNFLRSFDKVIMYADAYEQTLTIPIGVRRDEIFLCFYFELFPTYNWDEYNDDADTLIELILNEQIKITKCSLRYWIEYEKTDEEINFPKIYNKSIEELRTSIIRYYYTYFKKTPLYKIGYPDDSYCSGDIEVKYVETVFSVAEYSYFFQFYNLLNQDHSLPNCGIRPIVFSPFYFNRDFLNINSVITILPTNTKTRRIGYLKGIIGMFEEGNYYPMSLLPIKVESLATNMSNDLHAYKENFGGDDKGVIKQGFNGASAKPYIELLKNLNIVTEINRSYILTKQTKPYFEINKWLKNKNQNLYTNKFDLNENDCLFYLDAIIRNDIIYMGTILQLAKIIGEEFSPKEMYPLLKSYLLANLNILNTASHNKRHHLINIIVDRIKLWEKEKKYAEHLVEPRINWLLDLKLISRIDKKGLYKFTDAGNRFINVIEGINEVSLNGWLDAKVFLDTSFYTAFDYIYKLQASNKWTNSLIHHYLNIAMEIFKTDAPRRIAASQAINYVCSMCLLENRQIINFNEVKLYLMSQQNKTFLLDWFHTENDGALTKQIL